MGDRCTLVIKEDNAVELFFGNWSGAELPDQLFWGPDYVEAYIRGHEAVDFWLPDLESRGCVGLDKDQKLLLFHGGVGELARGEKSKYFYSLMQALWEEQGWRVKRVDKLEEIAVHMGFPAHVVQWVPEPFDPWPLERLNEPRSTEFDGLLAEPRTEVYGVLIITPDARFGAMAPWDRLFEHGPDLLAHFANFPQASEDAGAEATIHLDPNKKEIRVQWFHPYCERYFPHLEEVWPGWTFHFDPPSWLSMDDDEEYEDEEYEDEEYEDEDVHSRVHRVLLQQPLHAGPELMRTLSEMGAAVSPAAEAGPPVNQLSIKEKAAIISRAMHSAVNRDRR